ncbi:hypothetical protein V7S43_000727 [Phytophthora oleae]|uniref:Uncharacterized protein n=1 Tax=Phytophthora oleae TaxID=2107226 RepID=A0ABD3GAG5_9STRA
MDWQAEYAKAAALEDEGEASSSTSSTQQTIKTPVNNVLAFLDLLLTQEGGEWWTKLRRRAKRAAKTNDGDETKKSDSKDVALDEDDRKQLKAMKKRLAAVAGNLVVELPELNASVNSNKSSKVRVLQLQLVCRMLRYGVLVKKHKEQRKQLKKEIRGLLDRVALLLDAENPPSLADEDERSPFQEFLQLQLATRLQPLLPELVKYLLRAYELEDEEETEDAEENNALLPTLQPLVKPPQPPAESPKSAVKGSILSALREERPAKRARPDTSGLFKEVQIPHQLQQKQVQLRPRKSRRVSKTHSSSSSKTSSASRSTVRSSQDSLLRPATGSNLTHKPKTLDFAKTGLASSTRKPGDTDLLRRAAMASSTRGPAAPFLHRASSERSHFTKQQFKLSSSPGATVQAGGAAATGKNQSPPLRRAATTSSVVMRTPDRPKRMAARTTRRVLVEASPPLRRPNGGNAAPRLLQPKSSRPGANPPPLFR